ncbi:MAG: pilus assembly protein PilM [Gammaproteobacteria bacterium]|nr:MAG: pilus assembly protein PilM [Gammaproteobacteria bacterium]PIE37188.1 MAG: pilus assembly protein PilM [Gammaproteobacteria bacterium]
MLGLDITATSVKLLELKSTKKGYKVVSYTVEPLPANAVNEKNLQDVEAVGDAIARAVKRSGTRTRACAVAVPSAMVITKVIQMPEGLKDHELDAQIQLEADQYIPYSLEEVNLDFFVKGPSEHAADMIDVLLAASRSENVEDRTAAAEIGGLDVKIVDVEPYTMENAFQLIEHQIPDGGAGQTVAILDIGASMTSLCVLRDRELIYTREQPFGGKQLTEEIMRRYGLSFEDAGRVKRTGGLPDTYEEDVLNPFRDLLVQQANRFLQFFFSADKNDYVDHIVMAGGCTGIPDIRELIEQRIGTPTVIAEPFAHMPIGSDIPAQRLHDDGPAMMIACGLALRGVQK